MYKHWTEPLGCNINALEEDDGSGSGLESEFQNVISFMEKTLKSA